MMVGSKKGDREDGMDWKRRGELEVIADGANAPDDLEGS